MGGRANSRMIRIGAIICCFMNTSTVTMALAWAPLTRPGGPLWWPHSWMNGGNERGTFAPAQSLASGGRWSFHLPQLETYHILYEQSYPLDLHRVPRSAGDEVHVPRHRDVDLAESHRPHGGGAGNALLLYSSCHRG